MAEENNIPLRIRAYLEGRMSAEEQKAFEAERISDPELDKEVKLTLLTHAGLAMESQDRRREELKTLLQSARNKEAATTESTPDAKVIDMSGGGGSGSSRSMWSYLAIAATVLVIAGLIWNFGLKPQEASPSELFASNYAVPPAPEQMGSPVAADSLLRLGHAAYNREQYAEAKRLYELALSEGVEVNKQPNLYLGIAALEANDIATARKALADAHAQQPERADWYLALLELREGRAAEAKSLLEAIAASEGHYYQANAQTILERL